MKSKNKVAGLVIMVFLLVLAIQGCKKEWRCYATNYSLGFSKGTDTIRMTIYFNKNEKDSIKNAYQSNGYQLFKEVVWQEDFSVADYNAVKEFRQKGCVCNAVSPL